MEVSLSLSLSLVLPLALSSTLLLSLGPLSQHFRRFLPRFSLSVARCSRRRRLFSLTSLFSSRASSLFGARPGEDEARSLPARLSRSIARLARFPRIFAPMPPRLVFPARVDLLSLMLLYRRRRRRRCCSSGCVRVYVAQA